MWHVYDIKRVEYPTDMEVAGEFFERCSEPSFSGSAGEAVNYSRKRTKSGTPSERLVITNKTDNSINQNEYILKKYGLDSLIPYIKDIKFMEECLRSKIEGLGMEAPDLLDIYNNYKNKL